MTVKTRASRRPRQIRQAGVRATAPVSARRPARRQLLLAGIVAVITVVVVVGNSAQQPAPAAPVAGLRAAANVLGDPAAPVTIEEWADFQCPACRTFAMTTESQLRSDYIATGKVRFVFRHMAFLGPESIWAAEAAECAGDANQFWPMHDRLYAAQQGENNGAFSKANLQKVGDGAGLGVGFGACLASGRYGTKVGDDTAAGVAKGVTATPTLFVNGRKLEGVQTIEQLRAAIDPLLR